jgi:hypothetical protein
LLPVKCILYIKENKMNGFDLTGLSPEELQQLTIHCIQSNEELTKVVGMLMDWKEWMDERTDKLEKVVMEEIVGGVEDLYKKNMHDSGLEDLKGKYGSMFEPHMGALSEMYPGVDLYEELLKEKEGYPDEEAFGGRMNELSSALKAKLDKIRGVSPEAEAAIEQEPVAEEVTEQATGEEAPGVPETPEVDSLEIIKKMKGRKNPLSVG